MTLVDRFLKYVSFDTQSDESTGLTPSTPKQMIFAEYLKKELEFLGLEDITLDEHGYLFATLPANINKEVPTPNADAKRITKLVKHDGDVVGYELSNGQRVSKDEGIQMAKMGEIAGIAVATRKGNEYLRSLPDENENNNLGNLPSITY